MLLHTRTAFHCPPPMAPPHHRKHRRILTLPAVYPCEAISPAPLLASLLSLAADVPAARRAGDPGAYPVLRGLVREAVRLAGILQSFLEEVSDSCASPWPGAAVLGFSEMHVALQRLRFLVTDCAEKGARAWVLMNADLVASELRVVLGAFATAVDVLPLAAMDASPEARELARLLAEQAWRTAARPEPEDALAAASVRSMLEQFKNGVAPDADDVRRVLGRLGIKTWSECSEEVAFLEGELFARLEGRNENDNDLVLIGGLMAFMVYCRVVLFHRIDAKKEADAAAPPSPARCAEWINPAALQCPITLELMTDPVTVATGQTYERASIKKWMKAGCRTCPVTGERLSSTEVVPNAALRSIVERLLLKNGVELAEPGAKHRRAVDKTAAPFGAAAAGAARLAVAFLVGRLSKGDADEKKKATYEARKLSKHSVFLRACLVEADAVPWLLHLLSSLDASIQDNAVAALLNLSKHPGGRRALFEAGGLGLVVDVINVGLKLEAQQNAAAILFYLSSNTEYCEEIGRLPEAIPTLVQLMREGAYRGRKNAVVSLFGLLQCTANHAKAVAAGAVPVLASLLASNQEDLANDAVALLERVAEQPVGASAVLASSALVARLAEFLGASASRSTKGHCVSLLLSLCGHGGDTVVALLGKMPGLMTSLYSLVADGSPQASKMARSLLNEIHRHYDLNPMIARPVPAAGDRAVRAL